MKKEIAMLIEELEKVKAKKEEMEKALKLEIKELKHENDVLRRNNGIDIFLFLISIITYFSLC
jgi:MFS-type transporter involved in bile tolerance (Atg22 family)